MNIADDNLHLIVFWSCACLCLIAVLILLLLLILHRKDKSQPSTFFAKRTTHELMWAIIPIILLLIMAIPATHVLIHINKNHSARKNSDYKKV